MPQIQKVSKRLSTLFKITLILIPLISGLYTYGLFNPSSTPARIGFSLDINQTIKTPEGSVDLHKLTWTVPSKVLAIVAEIFSVLPAFLSVWILTCVFTLYGQGEIFSTNAARLYRKLGWVFFLNALFIKPLADMIWTLTATFSNAPGHRYITLGFGNPNVEAILTGVVIIMISWVMLEAARLQEEQTLTI